LGFDWSVEHDRLICTSSSESPRDDTEDQDELPADLTKKQQSLVEQYRWLVYCLMSWEKPSADPQTHNPNTLDWLAEHKKNEEIAKFSALGYEWDPLLQAFVNSEQDHLSVYEVRGFAHDLASGFHVRAQEELAQGKVGDVRKVLHAMGFDWSAEQRVVRVRLTETDGSNASTWSVDKDASAASIDSAGEAQKTNEGTRVDDDLIYNISKNVRVPERVVADVVAEYMRLSARV
jgi:hypothetical protein